MEERRKKREETRNKKADGKGEEEDFQAGAKF